MQTFKDAVESTMNLLARSEYTPVQHQQASLFMTPHSGNNRRHSRKSQIHYSRMMASHCIPLGQKHCDLPSSCDASKQHFSTSTQGRPGPFLVAGLPRFWQGFSRCMPKYYELHQSVGASPSQPPAALGEELVPWGQRVYTTISRVYNVLIIIWTLCWGAARLSYPASTAPAGAQQYINRRHGG